MKTSARIFRNTSIEVISNVINLFLSFFFLIIIARFLGPTLYGNFSFITNFPLIFIPLTNFGLDCLLIREISRRKEEGGSLLLNSLILQLLLFILTFLIIAITLILLKKESDNIYLVYYFSFVCLLNVLSTSVSSIFRGFEMMEYPAILTLLERSLALIFGLISLNFGFKIMGLMVVFITVAFIKLVSSLIIARKRFIKLDSIKGFFELKLIKYFIKEGFPFAVSSFFTAFRWSIGIIILSKLSEDAHIGFYNLAFKLCYPIFFLTFAYSTAILPVMSVYYNSKPHSLLKIYKISCKLALVSSLPISIILWNLSDNIIYTFFGKNFLEASSVLKIIAWILPFSFLIYPLGNFLVAINRQKFTSLSNGINSIILLSLCLLLIPTYKSQGAAISLVISECILSMFYLYFVFKYLNSLYLSEFLLRPLLAAFSMGILVYLLRDLSFQINIIIGFSFYIYLLFALKIFRKDEIQGLLENLKFKS